MTPLTFHAIPPGRAGQPTPTNPPFVNLAELLLAGLIAGTLDTVVGFGGALLLLPILILLVGDKEAVFLSPLVSLAWSLPRMYLTRRWISWRHVGLFAVGIVPATIIGTLALNAIDGPALKKIIGGMLILFGAYYVTRLYVDLPQPKSVHKTTFPIVGFLSGFVGTVIGAGHGPINGGALMATGMPVRDGTATNGAVGGATAVFRAVSFWLNGSYTEDLLLPALLASIGAFIGAFVGVKLATRSKDTTLELVIGVVMIIAGIRMAV